MSACQCGQAHGACATEFQYAVKLVCGVINATPAAATPLAPGRYYTAINIHSPEKCDDINFRWKVAVANPLGTPPVVPVYQRPRVLGPDMAIEIDCQQIMATFPAPPPAFVKGWVVIEAAKELDVVAVYTGAQGASALVNSFHTERVPARCVPVCEELVMSLNTGVAPWQTVAPTAAPLGPVVPVSSVPGGWAPPPFGATWVSQLASDGAGTSVGTRTYELCFDLCSGFQAPAQFPIQVQADDSAKVYLNTTAIGTVPYPGYGTPLPAPITVNTSLLHPGRNCFRIEVTNGPPPQGGPTGFAVSGILRVPHGKCPCRT
jgi:hypothetical protein